MIHFDILPIACSRKSLNVVQDPPGGHLDLDFQVYICCLAIMETLYKGLGDNKYSPGILLRQYVDAGWLGKKSGNGIYDS